MGREINGKSKKNISRNKYFEDINTEKGSLLFKKDKPIRFLAEMRMFPKWECW